MSVKFEYLPEVVLEKIFDYLHPADLFEYYFLSKYLSKLVGNTIRHNLTYSAYDDLRRVQDYQRGFIERNGLIMKHLNIIDYRNFEFINTCPNLVSLYYKKGSHKLKEALNNKLPELKRMIMDTEDSDKSLELFKNYLKKLEYFEYYGNQIMIKKVVKYLEPSVLKTLKIHIQANIYLDGIERLKTFRNLNIFHLKTIGTIYAPVMFTQNDFISNPAIEIKAHYHKYDIKCFGNPERTENIQMVDTPLEFISYSTEYINTNIHKVQVIETKSKSDSYTNLDDIEVVSTSSEAKLSSLTREKLLRLNQLPNIESITLEFIWRISTDVFSKRNLHKEELYDEKYKALQSNSIKRIMIEYCYNSFNEFFYFLSLFPKLEYLEINTFGITTKRKKVNYEINTPLEFITHKLISNKAKDQTVYNKIKVLNNIRWTHLKNEKSIKIKINNKLIKLLKHK